jgi:hypothetical protein
LRGRLAKVAGSAAGELPAIALRLPDPQSWSLETLCARDEHGRYAKVEELLQECTDAAYRLSDELGALYFTHSDPRRSVGA